MCVREPRAGINEECVTACGCSNPDEEGSSDKIYHATKIMKLRRTATLLCRYITYCIISNHVTKFWSGEKY